MRAGITRAELRTGGERLELACEVPWIAGVLAEGAANQLSAATGGEPPGVRVTVEHGAAPFDLTGWRILTRGAWCRPGQVIMRDACSSGLDLMVTAGGQTLDVVARWRPPVTGRAAAAVLRARQRLLLRAVLLQYPVLWRGQLRGRAPLHASVCGIGGGQTVLLAGPGGVGKSTLVHRELARGAIASCDNLCVSDGTFAWGVVEPLRLPAATGAAGRRMPHGRREASWPARADRMRPDVLIVLQRGGIGEPAVTSCDPREAAWELTAGTYMAGELRRYWAFAATLALGTGVGRERVGRESTGETATALSTRLPCLKVVMGDRTGKARTGKTLRDLIGAEVARER